jgi:hypothetical protein
MSNADKMFGPYMSAINTMGDIRKVVGDPDGKLTPEDLVKRIAEKFNGVCEWRASTANGEHYIRHGCGWHALDTFQEEGFCPHCGRKIKRVP